MAGASDTATGAQRADIGTPQGVCAASIALPASHPTNHAGKVLRLTEDGGVPRDNPFAGKPDVKPEIYTYGHRNLQGLAWHPGTGEMWGTEIGPMGGDELNRLIPGGNYGWPPVSLGRIYNSSPASDQPWGRPGMEMPVMFWSPAISPSSLMIYSGGRFPLWRISLRLVRLRFSVPPCDPVSSDPSVPSRRHRNRKRTVPSTLIGSPG